MYHDISMACVGTGKATVPRSLWFSFLLLAASATQASSQTISVDDFNDGVADGWTTFDATSDRPHGPATFNASSGAYHFEGAGLVPVWDTGPGSTRYAIWEESSNPNLADGFVRATIRADTEGTDPSVLLRMSGNPETGLTAYMFLGTTHHGGRFFFNKIVNNRLVLFRGLPQEYSFSANEDWNIEAGAVGDQLSMKVWRVGDPEPTAPQWTFTDTTLSTGSFGIEAAIDGQFPRPALVSATFDDVFFTFPRHDDPFMPPPYDIYLWEPSVPIPQVEGPFFTPGAPEKPDMRGDVVTTDWPDLRISGRVTDLDGDPIPGLKLDFWQVDDQGSYDNSGGYDLRGHIFTDQGGNYELWTVMPANYESVRTRHMHLKLGGENQGYESWTYTTQLYFPDPYDNDIDADGAPDKVIEGGVQTEFDAIALEVDFIIQDGLIEVGADFSNLAANILTLNNDPLVDGYFDTSLDIVLPDVFQSPPLSGDYNGNGLVDQSDLDLVLLNWGNDVSTLPPAWVNHRPSEGIVDQATLDAVLLNWGNGAPIGESSIPEPSSTILIGISAIGLGLVVCRSMIKTGPSPCIP